MGSVSSAAPKEGAQASSLPLPFMDTLPHMASPHQHAPPPQDPAKKSDNKAIGAWGEEQGWGGGADRPGFLSFGIAWPHLHVAEGVKITQGQGLDLNPRAEASVGCFWGFVVIWLVGGWVG